jgi:hypothetical protein
VAHVHNGVFTNKEKQNYVIFRKVGATGDYHVEQDKKSSER